MNVHLILVCYVAGWFGVCIIRECYDVTLFCIAEKTEGADEHGLCRLIERNRQENQRRIQIKSTSFTPINEAEGTCFMTIYSM